MATPIVVAGRSATDDERRLAEWGKKVTADPLAVRRATAQHWQTTTSAITGLFGAASIIGSDAAVANLAYSMKYVYGLLVALSLICAACAISAASRAGEAVPLKVTADLRELKKEYDGLVTSAGSYISRSRSMTLLAVILLVMATGVRWYAPRTAPPPTRFELVQPAAKQLGTQ